MTSLEFVVSFADVAEHLATKVKVFATFCPRINFGADVAGYAATYSEVVATRALLADVAVNIATRSEALSKRALLAVDVVRFAVTYSEVRSSCAVFADRVVNAAARSEVFTTCFIC